jgi:spore coat protein CotH
MKNSLPVVLLLLLCSLAAQADEADRLFDDSIVHEIRIYFDDPNWYDILYESHANDPEDPYFSARIEYEEIVMDPVGVRFKGNSSFGIPGPKKGFKIDFDEYDEDNETLVFLGLKKLNLHNGFKDPTMLREKLFHDFAAQYLPTIRSVHARIYVNDVYWGLYLAVEQVDKTFAQSRYDDSEDGNLFKAAASDDVSGPQGDFGSDLTWLGSDPLLYHDFYQLKTNETADDYTQLIEFIDVLNNTPTQDFPANLEPLLDVWGALASIALNSLFVNLDSYASVAHNYYLYDRDNTGRITHLFWDTNEAFGRFLMGVDPWDDPLHLNPYWLPSSLPFDPDPERPLMEKLWEVGEYSIYYENMLALMLTDGFDTSTMETRIDELADLIRTDVYADVNKMYNNSDFETNLYYDISEGGPGGVIFGLRNFVTQRAAYLSGVLPPLTEIEELYINEFMADNENAFADEHGDFNDWVEIYNSETHAVNLAGYYFTDGGEDLWRIPDGSPGLTTVPAEGYLVIWFDKESEEGPLHVEANLDDDGEEIYLYAPDRVQLVDYYQFGLQYDNVSEGRYPDGGEEWVFFGNYTPGTANQPPVNIPPWVETVVQTPLFPTVIDTVQITALVQDLSAVSEVLLWFEHGSGWQSSGMSFLDDDSWGAAIQPYPEDTVVSYYVEAVDDSGAVALYPDGAPETTLGYIVLTDPCAQPLLINEFLASNDAILPDEFGEFDDWVELYNPTDCTMNLNGIYITDDLTDPTKYRIELEVDSLLAGGEYALIWCDDDSEQGPFHTDFKLSSGGEQLGVMFADGLTWADSLSWGEQTADIAFGRYPNGEESWDFMTPTPGFSNGGESLMPVDDLQITIIAETVFLNWSTAEGATGYNIYGCDQLWGEFVQLGYTAATEWNEALPDSLGFYRVTSVME